MDADPDPITVEVLRDGRLRTRIHWEWNGDHVRVRVPPRLPQRQIDQQVAEIVRDVKRRRAPGRAGADADLESLARQINAEYFNGEIAWHSIRWVSNMRKRLGSCTVGGPRDGDIRISDRSKAWPRWVLEYVVAHELTHLKYPNHSKEFWAYVNRYPKAERAQGFILGIAFASEQDVDDWL
jgi:predicted metal-dependent hydrolase